MQGLRQKKRVKRNKKDREREVKRSESSGG